MHLQKPFKDSSWESSEGEVLGKCVPFLGVVLVVAWFHERIDGMFNGDIDCVLYINLWFLGPVAGPQ